MPPFCRRYEAALAPQSEQIWIESFSLTTERRRQAVERAFEQLAERHSVLGIQAYVRAGTRACATRGIEMPAIAHIGPRERRPQHDDQTSPSPCTRKFSGAAG
jgi:hypothetical protein